MLANAETFRAMTNYMNHPIAMRGGGIMLIAGLSLLAFWVAMTYWENYRQRLASSQKSPFALFQELCRTHNLNREQILLLQNCTQDQNELPVLFVDPALIESFAKSYPDHTPKTLQLRNTLFGHSHPL